MKILKNYTLIIYILPQNLSDIFYRKICLIYFTTKSECLFPENDDLWTQHENISERRLEASIFQGRRKLQTPAEINLHKHLLTSHTG